MYFAIKNITFYFNFYVKIKRQYVVERSVVPGIRLPGFESPNSLLDNCAFRQVT